MLTGWRVSDVWEAVMSFASAMCLSPSYWCWMLLQTAEANLSWMIQLCWSIEKTCKFTSCYVVLWVTPTLWDLLLLERLCCASLQMKCCQLLTMNIINSSTWSHNTGSLIIILSLTISASTLPFLYEQHLGNGRVIYSHYALLIQGCVYYTVVLLSFYHIFLW